MPLLNEDLRMQLRKRTRELQPEQRVRDTAGDKIPQKAHVLQWDGVGKSVFTGVQVKCKRCLRTCASGTNVKKTFGKRMPNSENHFIHPRLPCLGVAESAEHYLARSRFIKYRTRKAAEYLKSCKCGSDFFGADGIRALLRTL